MKVKIVTLTLDYSLYPRHYLDEQTVNDYVHSLQAGAVFPPIIADKKSHRVVDGFTRYTAHLRLYGEGGEIEVDFRTYRNEGELLLDAIRLNTAHGQRISRHDMKRCVILCESLSLAENDMTFALNITADRLGELRAQIHNTRAGDRIAAKQATMHLIEKQLSAKQVEGVRRAGGCSQLFFINQVISFIETGILDGENDRVIERLQHLAGLLKERLKAAA